MFPKRGAIAAALTALALIVLTSFKTPDQATSDSIPSSGRSVVVAGASNSPGTSASASAAKPTPTAPPTADAAGAQTVTGPVVATRYGDVEVQVTVAGGTLTSVEAVTLPRGGRSGQISTSVAPILADEALTAQSAHIDIVSGATYTSEAYAESLQAALDQAGAAAVVTG